MREGERRFNGLKGFLMQLKSDATASRHKRASFAQRQSDNIITINSEARETRITPGGGFNGSAVGGGGGKG